VGTAEGVGKIKKPTHAIKKTPEEKGHVGLMGTANGCSVGGKKICQNHRRERAPKPAPERWVNLTPPDKKVQK